MNEKRGDIGNVRAQDRFPLVLPLEAKGDETTLVLRVEAEADGTILVLRLEAKTHFPQSVAEGDGMILFPHQEVNEALGNVLGRDLDHHGDIEGDHLLHQNTNAEDIVAQVPAKFYTFSYALTHFVLLD